MKLGLILFLIIPFHSLFASEMDSITRRYESISDSLLFFNDHMNTKIAHIINKANEEDVCSLDTLDKWTRKTLTARVDKVFIFSPLQLIADKSNKIDKLHIKFKDSIYKYVSFLESPVLQTFPLAPLISLNGHLIGSDKFSHFLNLGYEYFWRMQKGDDLENVLNYSKFLEKYFWGGISTGIISHADLVANLQGLRFFGRFFSKGVDPLTGDDNSPRAYLDCRGNKWVQLREFDFSEYVDQGWDEGQNCNAYRTKRITRKVKRAIKELERRSGKNYSCPIVPTTCKALKIKYSNVMKLILSPECLGS